MAKITIRSITGSKMTASCEMTDTPMGVLRAIAKGNEREALMYLFASEGAFKEFVDGKPIDESVSSFALLKADEAARNLEFSTPFDKQLDADEIKDFDDLVFVVSITMTVGGA